MIRYDAHPCKVCNKNYTYSDICSECAEKIIVELKNKVDELQLTQATTTSDTLNALIQQYGLIKTKFRKKTWPYCDYIEFVNGVMVSQDGLKAAYSLSSEGWEVVKTLKQETIYINVHRINNNNVSFYVYNNRTEADNTINPETRIARVRVSFNYIIGQFDE